MTIKIKKSDGTWQTISGGSTHATDVYFADVLGAPSTNSQLGAALDSKLNNNLGTSESGKTLKVNSTGAVITTETPVLDGETLKFQ